MKAAIYKTYGPPEVVQILEVPNPTPGPGQILIRVHATTVNRNDCGFRLPEYPYIIRPLHGLLTPRKWILGTEFAGVVDSIGSGVQSFKIGDRVFGLTGNDFGTHAELLCVKETGAVGLMPHNLNFSQAVAILDGPWLALNMLKALDLKKTRRLLINGASGSIGSSCVQLAKHYGMEITAVGSARSLTLVRELGAKRVLDYEKEDFTKIPETFDAVIDAVGKSSFPRCSHLLVDKGVYISSEFGDWIPQNPVLAMWTAFVGGKRVKFPIPKLAKSDVEFFKNLAEKGELRAVIDRQYPLAKIVEAYHFVQAGQKLGNVVINILPDVG